MKKPLLLSFLILVLFQLSTYAQTYNEDDKEGLITFLSQKTYEGYYQNGSITYVYQQYGITTEEMNNSKTAEAWIEKLPKDQFVWNQETPKRLSEIIFDYDLPSPNPGASTLDCSKFASLTSLQIKNLGIPNLDYSKNKKLKKLYIAMDPYDEARIYLNSDNNPVLEEVTFISYEFFVEIQPSTTINKHMKKISMERSTGKLDLSLYPNLEELKTNTASSGDISAFSEAPNLEIIDLLIGFDSNLNFNNNKKLKTLILRDHENNYVEDPTNRPSITIEDISTLETLHLSHPFNKVTLSNLSALNDFKFSYLDNLSIDNCGQIQSINENSIDEIYVRNSEKVRYLSLTNCIGLSVIDMPNLIDSKPTVKGCPNLKSINFARSKVSNLSNIEFGEKLESVDVSHTSITNLGTLSTAKNLKSLRAEYCSLEKIDLQTFILLESLYCSNNQLTSLNLSKCANLKDLYCSNNNISTLELGNINSLVNIDCANNKIEELDLSKCSKLKTLNCESNDLRYSTIKLPSTALYAEVGTQRSPQVIVLESDVKEIDLSQEYSVDGTVTNYKWVYYNVYDTDRYNPTNFTPTHLGNGVFELKGNYIGKILVCTMTNSKYPKFTQESSYKVKKYDSQELEGIRKLLRQPAKESGTYNFEVFRLTPADTLNWYNDESWVEKGTMWHFYWTTADETPGTLTSINFPDNLSYDNQLSGTIDLSYFPNLERLRSNFQNISHINLKGNSALTTLTLTNSNLSSIDLSECPNIEELNVSYNNLSKIDVSKCIKLTTITCNYNKIEELDINENQDLKYLYCISNKITKIDLSKNKKLISVVFNDNELTSLNLTTNSELRYIVCENNLIDKIILPTNRNELFTFPLEVQCNNNKFKFSTLPYTEKYPLIVYVATQDTMRGGEVPVNQEIDLSSEYSIKKADWSTGTAVVTENTTSFQWIDSVTLEDVTHEMKNNGNGKFTANNGLIGKTLICKMRNTSYPELTQLYTVKVVKGTTGIEEGKSTETGIVIYPNPVQDVINIKSDIEVVTAATLFDLSGRIVKAESGNVEQINVSDLPKGFYYLKASTQSGKQSTHKIKKQ